MAAVALAVMVTGCGGSDASGSDSAAPTATVRRAPTTTAAARTTSTAPAPGQEDFTAILADLLARRDEAYETNDVSILEQIYSTQCACLANGRKVIEDRKAEGVHTAGERLQLIRADVASRLSDDVALVRGVTSQGPNNLTDADGNVVRPGGTQPATAYIYELHRTTAGWVVYGITKEGAVEEAPSE